MLLQIPVGGYGPFLKKTARLVDAWKMMLGTTERVFTHMNAVSKPKIKIPTDPGNALKWHTAKNNPLSRIAAAVPTRGLSDDSRTPR